MKSARLLLMGAGLAAAGLLTMTPALALGELEPLTNILSVPGSAGLGVVTHFESSPYRGAGNRYDVLPLYLYEGERFFLHANRGGVKLKEAGDQRFDWFIEQRLEGFPADRLPASLTGMATRDSGIDMGLSWRYRQPWGTVQAELLHDIGGFSKGSEFRLGYTYDLRYGRLSLRPNLSVALRDARLNNYYYGVQPGEATPGRAAYSPGAGLNTTLGLYGSYDLSQRWRLLAGVSATVLDRQLKDSPIVQKRVLPGVYVGAAYDFGGHKREWVQDGSPTWFKLLYGKATDDGCHLLKIVTAQCLSTASVNPTSITGLQVGKPFLQNVNGWPLDFVGYAGLTSHNDRGLQANGLQLDLFMKAFYTGFPWSERVKTRLGMGVGVSLAQRAPYIEASSQAMDGKPASRLLNYLDPTLDVSLGDLVGSRALKDTFIGFGVSHRSGIFGSSRLLGNVSGGSNYIYTYVESAL
ncbi:MULTISPECIES: MipA/OmpV family protein [unclassified Polaromonas]|uniref:MipA/OmpV family protein n=1 Tax=unclassified Polaromonas TaxID=2638319 RepID=UPI0018CAFA98|nr:MULTISPECIES: MipA/OmpV family protein [unclassified Polaromonas]MBG6073732.1 outer membrane protein [Polaromonas sp. CG_9.7]MBG6115841.1 outer membrane protein [Polaromonas sp. CG_9.2]MDH6183414.1 outer membrane protein [Polaromonas sp. CG_23.6]